MSNFVDEKARDFVSTTSWSPLAEMPISVANANKIVGPCFVKALISGLTFLSGDDYVRSSSITPLFSAWRLHVRKQVWPM